MLKAGEQLLGRYQIDEAIGSGGMGLVYRGRQTQRGMTVAIKEIECHDEASRRAVRAEAETLSRLSHPNLPRVYDFLEAGEHCYIVMEFVQGSPMSVVISEARRLPTEPTVLTWARQLCDVLRYLHAHKPPVIFKDLKPSNVMLTSADGLKVIDFGISKTVESPLEVTRTISRGAVSAGFSPPEQYVGGTDVRSDIYSLGATLYCFCCGRKPPESVELATRVQTLTPLRSLNAGISERTAAVIEWMLALNPEERPQSMQDVIDAFAGKRFVPARGGKGAAAATVATPRPVWLAAPVVVSVALLGLLGWLGTEYRHRRAAPPPQATPTAAALKTGHLRLQTTPTGAAATIDKKAAGQTPLDIDLSPGIHEIALSLPHYDNFEQTLQINEGTTQVFNTALTPLRAPLVVGGLPAGAKVFVDGNLLGSTVGATPLEISAAPGTHVLSWSCAGYNGGSSNVKLEGGERFNWRPPVRSLHPRADHPSAVAAVVAPPSQSSASTVSTASDDNDAPASGSDDEAATVASEMASLVVPGQGIDGLKVGMTMSEVQKRFPRLQFAPSKLRDNSYVAAAAGIVTFVSAEDRIVAIRFGKVRNRTGVAAAAYYHTAGGVRYGAPLSALLQEFGPGADIHPDPSGSGLIYAYHGRGIHVQVDPHEQKVLTMTVGFSRRR
jgi:serine/threonine-protein kinase